MLSGRVSWSFEQAQPQAQLSDPSNSLVSRPFLFFDLTSIEEHVAGLTDPVSAMVEKVYGLRIIEIEQSIEAISLDPASARLLGERPGAPALKAVRRYYDSDRRLIELAIAIHPSERFAYVTRLKRE